MPELTKAQGAFLKRAIPKKQDDREWMKLMHGVGNQTITCDGFRMHVVYSANGNESTIPESAWTELKKRMRNTVREADAWTDAV